MQAHEPCKREGCARARTRHSVFCDEHHEEQLKQVGLLPKEPPDRRAEHLRRCERMLIHHAQGVITTEELHGQLADVLVHCSVSGELEYWPLWFDVLPPDVIKGLLAYLRVTARPHGFFLTFPERVEAAHAAKARLIVALESQLRHLAEPVADFSDGQ